MKKEIEFDFAKWGQEGISAMIGTSNVVTLHKCPFGTNTYYGYDTSMRVFNQVSSNVFKMFEEVKPREFWVNVYQGGSINIYESEVNARGAYESSMRFAPKIKGETIKVREVLD